LVPLAFGIGTALTTLVGMAAGAGDWRRARSVAWVGAGMAAALTGALGLVVALVPHGWAGMFSGEPVVIEAAVHYLTRVAPFYGCIGFGMAMSFASQGANRQGMPLAASVVRLCVAGIGGYLCVAVFGADLPTLFWMLAAAVFLYAAIVAASLLIRPWGPRRR
ncbi:MAG: MATE family efflux transporter, partial [Rhodospirillales bacterium]|nr:MATE family efflux transporter [Rhodospirillales bacterium]